MYYILKCKNFLIGFLDKLGNFKYINSIDLENSKILQLAKSWDFRGKFYNEKNSTMKIWQWKVPTMKIWQWKVPSMKI